MTEGLGLTAIRGDEWLEHPGSVGKGYRDAEIRVIGPAGDDVPAGELGEIYLRSPTSGMYRYLGGAPLLPTTADGFGTAGDIGRLDADGYLYVVDRRVDMIITGGVNVFPAEVETALSEHPDIADVVVVGLADPEWGRRVHAIVEPTDPAAPPTAADVIAFAKARVAVQGAEDGRVRRRHPPQRGHQGEPRRAHRGARRVGVRPGRPARTTPTPARRRRLYR